MVSPRINLKVLKIDFCPYKIGRFRNMSGSQRIQYDSKFWKNNILSKNLSNISFEIFLMSHLDLKATYELSVSRETVSFQDICDYVALDLYWTFWKDC